MAISNRKLWLHFDGANGSTSVIDSSPVTKTISSAGAFAIDTAQILADTVTDQSKWYKRN